MNTMKGQATAIAVDEGIELQAKSGSRRAAAFMTAKGIEFNVIVRVLSDPSKRRQRKREVLPLLSDDK